jgi:serine/threonine protein phosphatase PrpC
MGISISWRGVRGQRTKDNRDWCGVGLQATSALCALLDGSTSGPASGELARQVAEVLADWFTTEVDVTSEKIVDRIRALHDGLACRFRQDSASLLIAHVDIDGSAILLNVGDCVAGVNASGEIAWKTRPHTLANPVRDLPIQEISVSPLRHHLTRSFRSREFQTPDEYELLLKEDEALVLATDGFWASLDAEAQSNFFDNLDLGNAACDDDCSALFIKFDGRQGITVANPHADNFIMRKSG